MVGTPSPQTTINGPQTNRCGWQTCQWRGRKVVAMVEIWPLDEIIWFLSVSVSAGQYLHIWKSLLPSRFLASLGKTGAVQTLGPLSCLGQGAGAHPGPATLPSEPCAPIRPTHAVRTPPACFTALLSLGPVCWPPRSTTQFVTFNYRQDMEAQRGGRLV